MVFKKRKRKDLSAIWENIKDEKVEDVFRVLKKYI